MDSLILFTFWEEATCLPFFDFHTMMTTCLPVDVQTALRIRPFTKKERDDVVVLEPVDSNCVLLRPPPTTLTPSQKFVQQNLSPESIKMDRDYDFHFDQIIRSEQDQVKLWTSMGHPATLKAMEPLLLSSTSSLNYAQTKPTAQLVVGMGTSGSGKTHSLLREAKNDTGIAFQIMEGMFRQSQHIKQRKYSFAINISARQVTQPRKSAKERDCMLHDLFHNKPSLLSSSSSSSSSLKVSSKLQSLVGHFERAQSGSTASSSSYSSLEEPVFLEQEKDKIEFRTVNAQTKMVRTYDEARDALVKAIQQSRRNTNKQLQSHVLLQIQPLLVDKRNNTVAIGNTVAILDMASFETVSMKRKGENTVVGARCDGHASLIHCLRTLQENDKILATRSQTTALKKIPYLQHKLTRLLQPLFSPERYSRTNIVVLVHAYPGQKDHSEKRQLLQEIETLRYKSEVLGNLPSSKVVGTPRQDPVLSQIVRHSNKASTSQTKKHRKLEPIYIKPVINSPVVPATISTPKLQRASSMSYSESTFDDEDHENIVPIPPPPYAPDLKIPEASAIPVESVCTPTAPVEYPADSPYASAVLIDQQYSDHPMIFSPMVPMPPSVTKPKWNNPETKKKIPLEVYPNLNSKTKSSQRSAIPRCPIPSSTELVGSPREESRQTILSSESAAVDAEMVALKIENKDLRRRVAELEKEIKRLRENNERSTAHPYTSPPQSRLSVSPTAYEKTPPVSQSLMQHMEAIRKQHTESADHDSSFSRSWSSSLSGSSRMIISTNTSNTRKGQNPISLQIPSSFKTAGRLN